MLISGRAASPGAHGGLTMLDSLAVLFRSIPPLAGGILLNLLFDYTDSFRAYDVLDVSDFHHVRINHSKRFAEDCNHINGIENFWN